MDDPIRVSATDFDKQVHRYQDVAMTQAVVVTRDGQDSVVMISAAEYDRLKRRDRKVFAAGELPADLLDAVRRAEVAPQHSHLDRILDDWHP